MLKGHTNCVMSLAVLADGRLASGSWDNTVRLWAELTGSSEVFKSNSLPPELLALFPPGLSFKCSPPFFNDEDCHRMVRLPQRTSAFSNQEAQAQVRRTQDLRFAYSFASGNLLVASKG